MIWYLKINRIKRYEKYYFILEIWLRTPHNLTRTHNTGIQCGSQKNLNGTVEYCQKSERKKNDKDLF